MTEPNITDWLEALSTAVAALFAIIGVIFAWKSFKKDLSGQQTQIDALVNFTDAIGKQTETLKESAKIDSQILLKLIEHIGISSEFSKEQEERYKLEIRPYFNIGGTSSGGGQSEYIIRFINDGGDLAILTQVTFIENNFNLFVRTTTLPLRIGKGKILEILLVRGSFQGAWKEAHCKIELKFTDKTDRNKYRQVISFENTKVKIGSVEEDV